MREERVLVGLEALGETVDRKADEKRRHPAGDVHGDIAQRADVVAGAQARGPHELRQPVRELVELSVGDVLAEPAMTWATLWGVTAA